MRDRIKLGEVGVGSCVFDIEGRGWGLFLGLFYLFWSYIISDSVRFAEGYRDED